MGVNPLSQIGRDMDKLAGGNESVGILDGISEMGPGMDGGGMGEMSIAEVISGNRSGVGDQAQVFTGSQGQGGVSMDALYTPGDPMGSGIGGVRAADQRYTTEEDAVPAGRRYMYPTLPGRNPDAILGSPYQSGGQNQANLIGSNPDRAQMKIAEIRRQRALRDATDGFGESRAQDYMGGQQTEPTAIAQLMKLIGSGAGNMFSSMFSPSQAGAGSPEPTVPNLNPPGPGARFAGPMLDRPGTFGGSRRMY